MARRPETPIVGWARRVRKAAGLLLVFGGLLGMAGGGGALLAREQAERSWAASEGAIQAARRTDAPAPRWIEAGEATTPAATTSRTAAAAVRPPVGVAAAARAEAPIGGDRSGVAASGSGSAAPAAPDVGSSNPSEEPTTMPGEDAPEAPEHADPAPSEGDEPGEEPEDGPAAPGEEPPLAQAEPRASPHQVEILASEFRFLDPPEPGAQATIGLQVRNHAPLPTGPLRLSLSTRWLRGWRVVEVSPPVVAGRLRGHAQRDFDFPGLDPETEGTFELHLVATDDAVDPPELQLALAADEAADGPAAEVAGTEIGWARPETVAPRPRPGPARSLSIPRLGLRAAVVPTTWEPPSFVVGQLRETANLYEGNTVLIGHLDGLGGDVFARISELEPGDEVIAVSRGLEYHYVVSETMVLPGDDSIPVQPTESPRLTLMTCIGDWDPIGLDYSHRLWVVAEPPELAETTLAGETPGPLTRQLGLAPALTILPPEEPGPSPKETPPDPSDATDVAEAPPGAEILDPSDGARVGSTVVVRGQRSVGVAEAADPSESLWLAIRAEIEGSRWYVYGAPLAVARDGSWTADLEIGGGPGIRHTIVVAPVDAATDARLRRHVAQQPGEPLSILPDAFEAGARIVVERQ